MTRFAHPFDALDLRDADEAARRALAEAEPWRDVSGLADFEAAVLIGREEKFGASWGRTAYGGTFELGAVDEVAGPEAEDLSEKHDVMFAVQDSKGGPYGGLHYILQGPDGQREAGQLGSDGRVDRKSVDSEAYVLTLVDLGEAMWLAPETVAKHPVELHARVEGIDEGTEIEVRIFQRFEETDDDVIATLSATVSSGCARATWTYEHDPEGPFATDHGVVEIVAELRTDAEGPWTKTAEPLALQLPTIDEPAWSDDEVAPGETVAMSVSAEGVPPGTALAIEIYKKRRSGDEILVDQFPDLTLDDAPFSLEWAFPDDGSDVEADCFFVATLDGDPNRIAVSDMLTVSSSADDDEDEDEDEDG